MPRNRFVRHLPAGTTWEVLNTASDGGLLERARKLRAEYNFTWMESKCVTPLERRYTNGEIAEIFNITPHTVDNHTSSVHHKANIPQNVNLSVAFLQPLHQKEN